MKHLLSLCIALFGFHTLYAQSQMLVPRHFTISGKVHANVIVPGHEYVYLYTNFKEYGKDSALVQMDSTFEFKFNTQNTPLAFSVHYRHSSAAGLLPPTGNVFLDIYHQSDRSYKKTNAEVEDASSNYVRLKKAANKPLELVKGKNLALVDSTFFNRALWQAQDSGMMVVRQYQDSIHPALFKELQHWLAFNTQIAYLDFALLKRLHQKEKSFDKVSSNYTQKAHLLLADTNHLLLSFFTRLNLKERVEALEAIEFQTSRFNPFEYNCSQIDARVLKASEPQPDGLQCNYGLTGAVGLYLFEDEYLPGWLIAPRFEKLTSFTNQYAMVVYNGRVGVIDACQNFTVQPNYSYLRELYLGKDATSPLYIFRGASNFGLLDAHGRHLLEENYDFLIQLDKARLAFRPENGTKYGIIDTSGKVILPPKYDVINANSSFKGMYEVFNLHPFLKVKKRVAGTKMLEPVKLFGLVDSAGNEIVKPGWNYFEVKMYLPNKGPSVKWMSKKYLPLQRRTKSKYEGYISFSGRILAKPRYQRIANIPYTEGYVLATNNKSTYLINVNGQTIKPIKFKHVAESVKGRTIVKDKEKYYVIDSLGNYLKYGAFEDIKFYSNDYKYKGAEVLLKSNGKWGLYSLLQQQWVIAPEWDEALQYWRAFYFRKGQQWGFTDMRNPKVPTTFYDTIIQRSFGYYEARKQQQKIILDSNGTRIFETDAEEVFHLNTGYFADSNFIVMRGKQLYKIIAGKEIPMSLDKVSLLGLYDINQTLTALVNRTGLIMGYGDESYYNRSYYNEYKNYFNPSLGNGLWHISNNGLECIIDEEANVKIPAVYRMITPLISVNGRYRELSFEYAKQEEAHLPRYYQVRSKKFKSGIYDAQFKMILDTLYHSISIYGNQLYYANKKGLYIKELGKETPTKFVRKGSSIDVKLKDKMVIVMRNGKKGIYTSQGERILKPKKYRSIILDAGGLMAVSKNYGESIYQLYLASGKRISRKKYLFQGEGTGIARVQDKKDVIHLISATGKDLLQYQPWHSAYPRVANFSNYIIAPDTHDYYVYQDTAAGLITHVYTSKQNEDESFQMVSGGVKSSLEKDLINQVLYLFSRIDIKSIDTFEPAISKLKFSYLYYDYQRNPNYTKQRSFYYDTDSIYGIYAEDVISDSAQTEFATMLVNTITADKNIKWETCVKPDRLFRFLSLETDFTAAGLSFTTHSFKDLNGDDVRREQFFTWQELAPYLNKNHVLAKRFQ